MTTDAIPSLIALIFKAMLMAYALRFPVKNAATRLYLVLLALLSIHNVIEFAGFNHFAHYGLDGIIVGFGYAYFAIGIVFFAVILHISLRLSLDDWSQVKPFVPLLYAPVLPLEYLLLGTNRLVAGFRLFENYTILRIPGPLYFIFETYVPLYLLAAIAYLIYGARTSRPVALHRTRNRLWLFALLPFVAMNIYLIVANHFGIAKISSTAFVPIAITFFLLVTTYATHQYRLFDVEFFIPWSKLRRRKTAFYGRIQDMIGELAELKSVKEAVVRVGQTLECPVVLFGACKGVVASSVPSPITAFPADELRSIQRIIVTNEIADRLPSTHAVMRRHGIAAVVPFHATSESAAGWLVLGDPFSSRVYTARDFRLVERLFDRLADCLLDDLVDLRRQLAATRREGRILAEKLSRLEHELADLQKKNQRLLSERHRWVIARAARIATAPELPEDSTQMAADLASSERTLDQILADIEARLIEKTLRQCRGNKSEAARLLGLRPNTLHYKLVRYGLTCSKQGQDGGAMDVSGASQK